MLSATPRIARALLVFSCLAALVSSAGSAFATPTATHAPAPPRVHFVGKPTGGQILFVDGARGSRPIVAIGKDATVEKIVVSPSGRHALFYAQLKPSETRTAVIVDLVTAKVTGTYRPGFGGDFTFSASDTVVQVAGCGSGCATMEVHDLSGKELGAYECAGFDREHELSPDRRFVACFDNRGLSVIDASTGAVKLATKTPCESGNLRTDFHFGEEDTVHFTCADESVNDDVEVIASWSPSHREITKHAVHAP